MADRVEKFSENARRALTLAQEAAQRLGHDYIGTEHLLLGIAALPADAAAVAALAKLGVSPDRVRSMTESIVARGGQTVVRDVGLTPRAKRVIELAVDEARLMSAGQIGSEQLLVGLVREGEGVAAGVLESLGVSLERVREAVAATPPDPRSPEQPRGRSPAFGFSDGARRVLDAAAEEARLQEQQVLGPEHILLALIRESDSLAGRVLADAGVQLDAARTALRVIAAPVKQPVSGEIGLTPAGKATVEAAVVQTRRLSHGYIGSEHMLLGLLSAPGETGARLMAALNLNAEKLRAETLRRIDLTRSAASGAQPRRTQLEAALRVVEFEARHAERDGLTDRAAKLSAIADSLRAILKDDRGGQAAGGGQT